MLFRLTIIYQKPLTVYFLRKAHDLYRVRPPKSLSPSFEDVGFRKDIDGFEAILPSIEYSLGIAYGMPYDIES
jgi:trafficking protein particle complex subunit 8